MAVVTEKFANSPSNTLNGALTAIITSATLHSTASFPNSGQFRILIDSELILVGAVAGAVFSSLTRGIENTVAATHADNATVTLILTSGSLARNPRSMSVAGDIEYLDANGAPASVPAPADGTYNVVWTGGVPSFISAGAATEISGVIKMYGGSVTPSGYLFCDGSAVLRATFAALFAIIGTTFGAGNGSTTFNLPDLRQRFPLGKAGAGTGATLGSTGGAIDHTHTVPALGIAEGKPNDTGTNSVLALDVDGESLDVLNVTKDAWNKPSAMIAGIPGEYISIPATVTSPGVSGAANPPFQVVNFIIKT